MHEAIENQVYLVRYSMDIWLKWLSQQGHIDETRERGEDVDEDFAVSLYQMEIDRVKYLLVSYLRTRITKVLAKSARMFSDAVLHWFHEQIEKHVLYIMLASDLRDRLSEREVEYAKRCVAWFLLYQKMKCRCDRYMDMMESHFKETILKNLPTKFASPNDTKEDNNMSKLKTNKTWHRYVTCSTSIAVDEPNLDNFVFCRINTDVGELAMDLRLLSVCKRLPIYITVYTTNVAGESNALSWRRETCAFWDIDRSETLSVKET